MDIRECIERNSAILMEGALGERLKREYHLVPDESVALASFVYQPYGRKALKNLWTEYITIADRYKLPLLATTPTRRANQERIKQGKFSNSIIEENVHFLKKIKEESGILMYAGGLMGCKGDAYTAEGALDQKEAREFHFWQADQFQKAGVDFLYAGIMPALSEAIGMAQAMSDTGLPYIISFTITKDGTLIDGATIYEAIQTIDERAKIPPICYMTNCVHPRILYEALSKKENQNEFVKSRFLGIQANTSPLSYQELDGCLDLKTSKPEKLADEMLKLKKISRVKIFGGCCGTDGRHIEEIAKRIIGDYEKDRKE